MRDAAFAACALAAVVSLIAALRAVHQREPLWQLRSGTSVGGAVMLILVIVSESAASSMLDLITFAYVLAFLAFAIYAAIVQRRSMAQR